jgi:predicted lipid-binding transport protein (Tim44 family)
LVVAKDLSGLAALVHAEMAGYFARDLPTSPSRAGATRPATRSWSRAICPKRGARREREYATVAMRFSLVDVTRRLSDGAVVEGDPDRRTEAVELWTFTRVQGGPWTLSAIQQTAKV